MELTPRNRQDPTRARTSGAGIAGHPHYTPSGLRSSTSAPGRTFPGAWRAFIASLVPTVLLASSGCAARAPRLEAEHPANPEAREQAYVAPSAVLMGDQFDRSAAGGAVAGDVNHNPAEGEAAKGSTHSHSGQDAAMGLYACPMHPEVVQETPGRCPKCGMNLVVKPGSQPEDGKEGSYVCPMHPEVIQGSPGRCPKCGMALIPKEEGER